MAVELLATPVELRRWLDLDDDAIEDLPDTRATMLLEGASKAALAYCRRATFAVTETTVRLDGTGWRELLVPGAPMTDLDAIAEDPDGANTDLFGSVEWSAHGIIRRTDGGLFAARFRWYEVTFSHGYDQVPEDARNVVLRVAARAVGNPEGLATETAGAYTAGAGSDDTRLSTLSAPDRRELDPYRL